MSEIQISTEWILDAVGDTGRSAVSSVYMIFCLRTSSKGSGFLLRNGLIVTNEHVIRGCTENEIEAVSAYGDRVRITQLWIDRDRDIAVLRPAVAITGGLNIADTSDLKIGESVSTWGYPLGYNGPAPLLSVGYLAGFKSYQVGSSHKKHLVVNGAFNSGNSGGALLRSSDSKIIGIVVSKHAPISEYHQSAIEALSTNSSGVVFTATSGNGETRSFVETQIVAELLVHMRNLTQVMIGEAVAIEELTTMLCEIDLSPPSNFPRNFPCHYGSGSKYKFCHGKLVL